MKSGSWLTYALITTLFWGIWGALIEITEKAGFPATLGYTVWALTMLVPATISLKRINWKLETSRKAVVYGSLTELLGAAGVVFGFLL